jgi:seryl-tRNA synthetase
MLDVLDFIVERGGNPEKVRESQRKRYAPETVVDEVIELWQDARKSESNWEGNVLVGLHSNQQNTKQISSAQRSMLFRRRLVN